MRKLLPVSAALTLLAFPATAYAHCPLCTVGSGALAVLAASLGVDAAAIGVFIGAMAVAMGLWIARVIRKRYIPGQRTLLTASSFAMTVPPMLPLFDGMTALHVYLGGDLGGWLNRTYMVNSFLLGTVLGGLLMLAAPSLSRAMSRVREGKTVPYQGMAITLAVLLIASTAMQMFL